MSIYIIILVYCVVCIAATYLLCHINGKKQIDFNKLIEKRESIWDKIGTHLTIICVMPLAMPFVLLYVAFCGVRKLYNKIKYKKRPIPVPKDKRRFLKCDTVLDENRQTMSLAKYNYIHHTNFTLDQVYGRGYESSLTEKEREEMRTENQFGNLKVQDDLPEDAYTKASIAMGQAMLTGEFDDLEAMLDDQVSTILYHGKKSINGKKDVLEYWKGWRRRFVETRDVKKFEVLHSNYYSHACIQMETMVVLFLFHDCKILKMVLAGRNLVGCYSYHDDLVNDYPFNMDYIKEYLEPLREANEFNKPVIKENRIPCMSCGTPSEELEWYSARINVGIHGYPAQVSICPKCGKVVEFFTEGRYRMEHPVLDRYDLLDRYATCWEDKSIDGLEECLSEDFHYSSFWVTEELDKAKYLEYLEGKFRTLAANFSVVKSQVRDGRIVLTQNGNNVVIDVKTEDGFIVRADMMPASFYGIPDKAEAEAPVRFDLYGTRTFYNDCPLKGSEYTADLPEDVMISTEDFTSSKNNPEFGPCSVRQIAEEMNWILLWSLQEKHEDLYAQVKACYRRAADDGIVEASNILGIIEYNHESNEDEANRLLNHAAALGSKNAMINRFSIHWCNREYLEASAMLANMDNKQNPSLMCLWNRAYLLFMGEDYPNNIIKKDVEAAKSILRRIVSYDKDMICNTEENVIERAGQLLDYIESSNIYSDKGIEFHHVLASSVVKTVDVKHKAEVFYRLNSLKLEDGYKLGLRLANSNTDDIGDESNFYVYGNGITEDKDILKYLRVKPTAMSAWQVYLLMTSKTVMPVFWHGGYIVRSFIFKSEDLKGIKPLKFLDFSNLIHENRILPSIEIKAIDADKYIADIHCCYWNDWKGLVREHTRVVFDSDRVSSFEQVGEFVYYKYDCGILF